MLRFYSMKSDKLWRHRKWTEDDGNLVQHTCDHVHVCTHTHTHTHTHTLKKTYTYLNDSKVIANPRWEMAGKEGRGGKQFTWKGISTLIYWDLSYHSTETNKWLFEGCRKKERKKENVPLIWKVEPVTKEGEICVTQSY